MKTALKVPIEDRFEVKRLGAKWDAARKVWFVPDGVDLSLFIKWVPGLSAGVGKMMKRLPGMR